MAREVSRARIGLFVIVAVALLFGGMVWLGSQQLFAQYDHYVTYYQGSVSGLEISAAVKYRGVTVGRVADIRIDPRDSTRVEIALDLRKGTPVKTDVVAEIRMTGITGIKYAELAGGGKNAKILTPGTVEAPAEIPSRTTLLEKVDERFEMLYAELTAVIQNLRELTGPESRERLTDTLGGISTLAKSLAGAIDQVQPGLSKVSGIGQDMEMLIATTQSEIQGLGGSAKTGIAAVTGVVTESPLPQTLKNLDKASQELLTLMDGLNRQVGQLNLIALSADMRRTLVDVSSAAKGIEQLAADLRRNPSSLIFSVAPADRAPGSPAPGR
ncbi:MAG: MCE family protein [Candidatus Schekmanbacteria bacterium]|nr:MCE family protein [Candidatus Schekmanbacteria bacterium]